MSTADAPRRCYTREKLLSLRHNRQLPPHLTRRSAAFLPPVQASNSNPPTRRPSPPPSPPPGFAHVQLPLQASPPRSPSPPPPEDRVRLRIARAPYMPDNFATRIAFHSRPTPSASPLTSQEIDALFDTSSSSPFENFTDRFINSNKPSQAVARFTHFREIEPRQQPFPATTQTVEPSKPPPRPDDQLDDSVLAFFEAVRARARKEDPQDSYILHEHVTRDSRYAPNALTNAHKVAPAQLNQAAQNQSIDLQNWFARLAQQAMQ